MTALFLTLVPLLALGVWEWRAPRQQHRYPVLRRRWGNIWLWFASLLVTAWLFTEPDEIRAPWAAPWWLSLVVGFVVIDLLVYWVHRANHGVPWLWRLHALHHTDPEPDWSTAVRHHPGEYVLMGAVYWVVILAVGVPGWVVTVHAGTQYVASVACHGNVLWPLWVERLLSPVLVTLDMHLVHHSVDPALANSNYGAVFSVWDQLFGTFALGTRDPQAFGVPGIDPAAACRSGQMLMTPLRI